MNWEDSKQEFQFFLVERRILARSIVLSLISLGLIFLVVWPLWSNNQNVNSSIKQIEKKLSSSSQRLNLIKTHSQEQQEDYDRVALALPDQKQPLQDLLAMREIASSSGALLSEYNLNPGLVSTESAETAPATTQNMQTFSFEVSLQGTLENIQKTFAAIENSLPMFEITEFDFSSNSESEYRVNLNLVSRYASLQPSSVAKKSVKSLNDQQNQVLNELRRFSITGSDKQISPLEYKDRQIF
jgi:hypothetical protein